MRKAFAAVAILSFCNFAPAEAGTIVPVIVNLITHGIREPIKGTITFRPAMGPAAPLVLSCCGGTMTVALPPRTAWEVIPALHGAWAARQVFAISDAASPLTVSLPVWPVARLSGRFEKPGSSTLPSKLVIAMHDPPGRVSGIGFGDEIECPIGSDGRWSCELPAATVDLLLRVNGFIPLQMWGFSIAPGTTRELGILKLRQGASVSGWVHLAVGKLSDGLGRAAIVPLVATGGGAVGSRVARPIVEAAVQKNGYFQIVGVPVGQYAVRVTYPGFAAETLIPVRVFGGSETSIRRPIVLRRPISLRISLRPSVDWQGSFWNVVVQHASPFSGGYDTRPIYTGPARDGSVVIGDQSGGRYTVDVYDSAGNAFRSEEFEVAVATDFTRTIHIDTITVRGTLRMGDEPVEATLWFGGRHGAEHVAMRSGADGQFRGILPRDGGWRVSIETNAKEPFQTSVDVRASNGEARISLTIPSNEVAGNVLDREGQLVAGASVTLITPHGSMTTQSGSDGSFRLRGVEPGDVSLAAFLQDADQTAASDAVIVHVEEKGSVGPVQLVLQPGQRLTGTVRSPHGPVAGAHITIFAAGTDQPRGATADTDLEGHFIVQIPGNAERATVTVRAPGCALRVFDVPLPNHAVVLNVPEAGGELDIAFAANRANAGDLIILVFQDDRPVPLNELFLWALSHGTRFPADDGFHLDDMAPAYYSVCTVRPRVIRQSELSSQLTGANCISGFLPPFGNLTLALPSNP